MAKSTKCYFETHCENTQIRESHLDNEKHCNMKFAYSCELVDIRRSVRYSLCLFYSRVVRHRVVRHNRKIILSRETACPTTVCDIFWKCSLKVIQSHLQGILMPIESSNTSSTVINMVLIRIISHSQIRYRQG